MAVPTKDCPWSWHSNGFYQGVPKRDIPSLAIWGGGDHSRLSEILGHSINHGSLGIPDPCLSAESAYNTSKAASRELVDSFLGGSVLNYVGHRACVHKSIQSARLSKWIAELSEMFER